jgi:hypothetical protein
MSVALRGAQAIRDCWEAVYINVSESEVREEYPLSVTAFIAIWVISVWTVALLVSKRIDEAYSRDETSFFAKVAILFMTLFVLRVTYRFIRGPGKGLAPLIIVSAFVAAICAVLAVLAVALEVLGFGVLLVTHLVGVVLVRLILLVHVIICIAFGLVALVFLASSPGFLWSRWLVIRPPRCRTPAPICEADCGSQRNALCEACASLVRSSALITGTWSIFTKPVETHVHHTQRGLLQSAADCHLCSLLKEAVDPMPASDGSTSHSEVRSSLNLVVSQIQKPGRRPVLEMRCDPEKHPFSVALQIRRLYGRS